MGSIDLDVAVAEIESRSEDWRARGFDVGPVTWRDQGAGWPPSLKTDRQAALKPDSIGVAVRLGAEEGRVVLFDGGWCDFEYWSGRPADQPISESPGYPNGLTVAQSGEVLNDLIGHFRQLKTRSMPARSPARAR